MTLIKVKSRGTAGVGGGNRNLIINGSQQIWQRTASTTTITNSSLPTVDRFRFYTGGATYTSTQSTDVPSGQGFGFSNKLDVSAADNSLGAGSFYAFRQRIEGSNCMPLCYGTSDAKTITLSFWVKSNKTGVYGISLYKFDGTAYMYTRNYTINSANTWEKKEITITPTAGSTTFITNTAGAIANDNSHGLDVNFTLSAGSNYTVGTDDSWTTSTAAYATSSQINWMDSTSNNFYITGVQLEVGETASNFSHLTFGEELALCQRYFYKVQGSSSDRLGIGGYVVGANEARMDVVFPVSMRAAPTISGTGTAQFDGHSDSADFNCSAIVIDEAPTGIVSNLGIQIATSGMTNGHSGGMRFRSDGTLTFTAEL